MLDNDAPRDSQSFARYTVANFVGHIWLCDVLLVGVLDAGSIPASSTKNRFGVLLETVALGTGS